MRLPNVIGVRFGSLPEKHRNETLDLFLYVCQTDPVAVTE
jgi:hypothetical protein